MTELRLLLCWQNTSAIDIRIQSASGRPNSDQSDIHIDKIFVTKIQKVEKHEYKMSENFGRNPVLVLIHNYKQNEK
jgi:hypothetical protein